MGDNKIRYGVVVLGLAAALSFSPALLAKPKSAIKATVEDVIAAERASADYALKHGWIASFLQNAAPEGIIFQEEATNVQMLLGGRELKPDNPPLVWWPIWAGISASGDLGFTTGPFMRDKSYGYYFTVWERQPDGAWKWIYDGGPPLTKMSPHGPETKPVLLAPSTAKAGSASAALAQVTLLERALAKAAATNAKEAYLPHLAADGWIASPDADFALGGTHFDQEFARRPAQLKLRALGGKASQAGDMVYTYGRAEWTDKDKPILGHYVRVWQNRTEGWKVVFDELLPN